jgi:hypothetical protein
MDGANYKVNSKGMNETSQFIPTVTPGSLTLLINSSPPCSPSYLYRSSFFARLDIPSLEAGQDYQIQFGLFVNSTDLSTPTDIIALALVGSAQSDNLINGNPLVQFTVVASSTHPSPITPPSGILANEWNILVSQFTSISSFSSITQPQPYLSLVFCSVSTSTILIDELRLFPIVSLSKPTISAQSIATPIAAAINPEVTALYRTMSLSSLRWPGGSHVDVFDWRNSIGRNLNFYSRNENRLIH